jgi:dihydrolipoamide dehydrogenase
MLPRIVPVEDEEVSKELERVFKKSRNSRGDRRQSATTSEDRQRREDEASRSANGKQEDVEAEKLLVAVGARRTPPTSASKNTKVELDRGFIKVNEYQQTAEPGVYAIGDVVAGTPQLAHVASMQGMVAVAHMAGKPATPINRNRIPGALTPSRASAASA